MIQKIKKFIAYTSATLLLMAPGALVPVAGGIAAAATISDNLCTGANAAASGSQTDPTCGTAGTDGKTNSSIQTIGNKIVTAFSIVVGVISIIMIIYGGFRYITSGGDSGRVGNAKNTIIYAIIGLIIVVLAQIIVHFVVNAATTQSDLGT